MLIQVSKANQKAETPILFSAIHTILTASVNRNIFPGKKKKKKGLDDNPSLYNAIEGGKKVYFLIFYLALSLS